MRMLSLSLVTFAVLSLVPAVSAQQAAPFRKANIQAKAEKNIAQQKARAKSMARFHAWQKSVGFKHDNVQKQSQATGKNRGKSMPAGKATMQGKAQHGKAKAHKVSNTKPVDLKKEFGKRYKLKAALRAKLKAQEQSKAKAKAHDKR